MSVINLLPAVITVFGLYFLIKLRFFFIIHPIKCTKIIFSELRKKGAFSSLSLALAGTLGVGNIVGVAHGISVGGAGCVFWILISSIFSMALKYSECTLAQDSGIFGSCSMAHLIKESFKSTGKLLSVFYAALTLFLSLTMGSSLQSNALVIAGVSSFGTNKILVSALFCLLVAFLVLGGNSKISRATSVIIPVSTVVYVFICIFIIITHITNLPTVISSIFSEAFDFRSAYGGVSSFLMLNSVKEGFARGLLSNEAGAGTSASAQTGRNFTSSASVGLFGIIEVFFDTTLLCTLTGVCVLLTSFPTSSDGIGIIICSFTAVLSSFAPFVVFVLILAFVYSTVICWYYYGRCAITFLFGNRLNSLYTVLFLISEFLGGIFDTDMLIGVCDYILFFMTLITLFTLIKNSERLKNLSEYSGLIKSKDSDV